LRIPWGLPPYWREIIREKMLEAARQTGVDSESIEREKERLKLKRGRKPGPS
jgi:hypothetical protein